MRTGRPRSRPAPQLLIEHTGLVTCLVGEALQGLGGRRCHLQPLEAAFDDVDGENDVPVPGCLSLARSGAKSVSGLTRHESAKRLERSIRDTQPALLALQPEAHGRRLRWPCHARAHT